MPVNHTEYMAIAVSEAEKAALKDEVPVGAVLISDTGDILSRAHNRTIEAVDPAAHAEILAIRKGAIKLNNYRLLNTTLYVTLEPCMMCMGAIVHARISTLVFGAKDPKWGAAGSLYDFPNDTRLNHRIEVVTGICEEDCMKIIQDFFKQKRKHVATD